MTAVVYCPTEEMQNGNNNILVYSCNEQKDNTERECSVLDINIYMSIFFDKFIQISYIIILLLQ